MKQFADSDEVAFGDVLLRDDDAPRDVAPAKPGAGGWPTIRYYNKDTGIDGKDYSKKTDQSMCDELGPKGGLLPDYIKEAGQVGLKVRCVIETLEGCDEQSKEYIDKKKSLSKEQLSEEIASIKKKLNGKMSPKNAKWANIRVKILSQMLASKTNKDEL